MAVDVADYASVGAAAAAVASGVGQVDILLNNAGIDDPSMAPSPVPGSARSSGSCVRTSWVLWRSPRPSSRCSANHGPHA
jgi:NAD(P)-dependent dehydrogenase (short-subunit alcohol dehydrogenase family)